MIGGDQSKSCPFGQRWFLIKLVGAIQFIGNFLKFCVALLAFCHRLHFVLKWLLITCKHSCLNAELLLP